MRDHGGTGRRAGLKILFPNGSVGSIPTGPTIQRMITNHLYKRILASILTYKMRGMTQLRNLLSRFDSYHSAQIAALAQLVEQFTCNE